MKKYKKSEFIYLLFALSLLLRPVTTVKPTSLLLYEVLNITLSPKSMRKNIASMKRRSHLKPIQTINSKWTQLVKVGQ